MALVGTISGSNGTSNTAVTGTLVIANVSAGFPQRPSDAVLFVSGAIDGNSKTVIGGDLVTSGTTRMLNNLTLSGSNVFIGGNVTVDNDLIFLDKSNSRVGIGTSVPEATLTIASQGTGNVRGVTGLHYDNTTAFSQFKFIGARARGSVGSPSAVQANDTLVSFNARGRTNTGWSDTVGGLYVYAKENWTSTNTPTFITLRGVSAGAGTTVSEWARIDNSEMVISASLISSGSLKSIYSSGNEGGEIFLSKAASGTTITSGVTIDVYQDKVRIFESGGTNRGGYWDISGLGAGVATNFAAAASSPGGSDSYVQYNDATAFGGDATFTFNDTSKILTVPTGSIYSLTSSHVFVSDSVFNSGSIGYRFRNQTANFNFTTQSFIGVNTSLGAYTGTLPVISGEYIGRMYVIKDVGGFCGTTAFVITASSPNMIDGATELKINAASGSVSLIAGISGSSYNWYIVGSN